MFAKWGIEIETFTFAITVDGKALGNKKSVVKLRGFAIIESVIIGSCFAQQASMDLVLRIKNTCVNI